MPDSGNSQKYHVNRSLIGTAHLPGVSLLILLLLVSLSSLKAQDLERKITIRVNQTKLSNVIKEIGIKGEINFSYNPRKIPVHQKISMEAFDRPVKEILNELLTPLHITYFITEKHVVLKINTGTDARHETSPVKPAMFTISGYIKDSLSGEVLIGVGIYDKNTLVGTISNAYGFYSLTLPSGEPMLTVSLIGYSKYSKSIILNSDVQLSINLVETSIEMQEVEIKGNRGITGIEPEGAGQVRFSSVALKRMSGFAGNVDVIKSLQSIPGIHAFGDGSSFYYVRGGNKDQNLLLLDEAPIYNPAHLFGFFSALAPDAVKDVKAYKSDFPASFGGRLSSVIDIHARDGNLNRLGFAGNIGIFTSDLTVEGPLIKEKSSFILSARRSNLNWLNDHRDLNGSSFTVNFYDLNAKLNIKINQKNRLLLTGFTGNDDFSRITGASVNTFGLSWHNATGTVRWTHLFNNKLFANTSAIFSQYNYYLFMSREQDDYWTSSIRTGTIKTDFSWFINPSNTVKTGIELSRNYSNPGNVRFSDYETQKSVPEISPYHSLGMNLYLCNDRTIHNKLSLKYGLRLSSWRNLGPATVYFFDGNYKAIDTVMVAQGSYYAPYYNLEPRLSITYALTPNSAVTGGYTRTVQYVQMLSNSTSPFTSLEVWAPSGPTLQPQKADQFTLGYLRNKRTLNFSVEVFYKLLYNQIDYEDHANMLYNPLIEGELRFGDSKSYGMELLLRKSEGKFSGWVGYSYARALSTINDLNGGREFPASFDHPHSLFANLNLTAGKRWDFAASWFYMTGSPFTPTIGFIQYNGYVVPLYGDKNSDRYPDYHRLDVSVTFRLNKPGKRFKHNLVLSVYNVYGHYNPFAFSYNKITDSEGNFVVPSDLSGSYEIIPTRISVAGVIPSLNYTFKF